MFLLSKAPRLTLLMRLSTEDLIRESFETVPVAHAWIVLFLRTLQQIRDLPERSH